jgi:glycosyltransferase involved in cell wall biosynthesis
MRTIPNGIDLSVIDRAAGPAEGRLMRERHGIGPGETVLLSVGRIEHNKGFDLLARALGRIADAAGPLARHGWHWIVAGAGPYRRDLERAIDDAGIGSHTKLVGRVTDDDLHAWYEASTIFVHPTRYEGSSLVTLEAMAHRKPIVATRAGGLPDKVRPSVNGWLVEPDDPAALADAIAEAAGDPIRLAAMGQESRRIVDTTFAWKILIVQYLELYDEILRERKAL